MLSYFPQVRPNESTYSIFARLQFALQPPNFFIMGTLLFNRKYEVGRLNFQNSFDYLCSNLPSKFTSETFFYNNTIYPLFIPFLSIEKQEQAFTYFRGEYPDKTQRCLTITNIDNNMKFIRVCKQCIKEDFDKYGEPYYRRQHEIELNRMCYKHKTPLYEYSIPNYGIPRRYDDYCTVLNNSKKITIPEVFKKFFINISKDIFMIFSSDLDGWNIEITKKKIFNRLREKGYLSVNGLKLQKEICGDFKNYYSEGFLDYINYNFNINTKHNWLRKSTTNSPDDNPIKFILLIRFLFGSFKNFYYYNEQIKEFIEGPYPCLNNICPNYNKLVIKDIAIKSKYKKNPIATFKCPHCGFTYTRNGPDKNTKDIYFKTSIKDRGYLWHEKFEECLDKNFTLKEIASILNCDSSVIDRLKRKYKNSNIPANDKIQNVPDTLSIQSYKNKVLSLIKENPKTNRQTAYKLNIKIYSYLLANNPEWIDNVFPAMSNKQINISKEEKINNYWLERDVFLSNELLKAIDKIKSETSPHKRITIFTLQRYIGYENLNRNRLPKCFEILDKVCESVFDSQKRKVKYAMKQMHDNGIKMTTTKVLYTVNLDLRDNIQEIHYYIEMMVNEYNSGNIKIIDSTDN